MSRAALWLLPALAGCSKVPPPELLYRVARSELDLGRTPWTSLTLPLDTLSILNLSEQPLLVTPQGFEGEGSELLRWTEFADYTEVRPGSSVSLQATLTADLASWRTGAWSPELTVEVGAAWNNPSDFDVAPEWFEDTLTVPVSFELDCDLDGDGEDSAACGGTDCDDGGPDAPPLPQCDDTGGTSTSSGTTSSATAGTTATLPGTTTVPPLTDTGAVATGPDLDGDGFAESVDCDDSDPKIHPGATDACDGVDGDCDGVVDLGIATVRSGGTYRSLQAAIDAAPPGGEVIVCDGTWPGVTLPGSLTLRSLRGAAVTAIDASGSGQPAVLALSGDVRVEGLTLTGGTGADRSGTRYGGGISAVDAASLEVIDCAIEGNEADLGGGIAGPAAGPATVRASTLTGNAATSRGGALHLPSGTVEAASIVGNTADEGGGIAVAAGGTVTLREVDLTTNTAATRGGGAHLGAGAELGVTGGTWLANLSDRYGGALYVDQGASASFEAATLDNNQSLDKGGALYVLGGEVHAIDTAFVGNTGSWGGVAFLFAGSALDAIDSALSFNTADQGAALFVNLGSAAVLTGSVLEGNVGLSGGGAFLSADASLSSVATDFGTGPLANVPDDVDFAPPGDSVSGLGVSATITCDTASNLCL